MRLKELLETTDHFLCYTSDSAQRCTYVMLFNPYGNLQSRAYFSHFSSEKREAEAKELK